MCEKKKMLVAPDEGTGKLVRYMYMASLNQQARWGVLACVTAGLGMFDPFLLSSSSTETALTGRGVRFFLGRPRNPLSPWAAAGEGHGWPEFVGVTSCPVQQKPLPASFYRSDIV
jgi:hypothetical protein